MPITTPDKNIPLEYLYPDLQIIAKLHRKGENTWNDRDTVIQRMFGGANNAIYKIETKTGTFACKLCVDDGRQRATREFGTLLTLWSAEIDLAPQPILLDESKSILPYPLVVYRWLAGPALQAPLTQLQLENFLASYHQLHSLQPSKNSDFQLDAWFHWFNFDAYLGEIKELAGLYTPWLKTRLPDGPKLKARLDQILESCALFIAETAINPGKQHIPRRLARVDPNTANAILGTDGCLRWVDWEYSGWGDPALDLAELRWHAALQPLGETALQWLRANYQPSVDDPGFSERVWSWDHILAARWPLLILRVLWSNHNGPDRERLTRVNIATKQLCSRLVYYIELAENLFLGANHDPSWR